MCDREKKLVERIFRPKTKQKSLEHLPGTDSIKPKCDSNKGGGAQKVDYPSL